MLAEGNASAAAAMAKSPRVARILSVAAASMWPLEEKAAVAVGTTFTPHWAEEIAQAQLIAASFFAGLKGYAFFDTAAPYFLGLPPNTRTVAITAGGTGSTPGEGKPVAMTQLELSGDTLSARVSYGLVAITAEVLKAGQGFEILNTRLRRAVTREVDGAILSSVIDVTGVISNSATGDFAADLKTAVTAMETSADSAVFAIAPPAVVKAAAFERGSGGAPTFPNVKINGGDANGITVLPSDALVDKTVIIDARQCAAFTTGPAVVTYSDQATLQLSDSPSPGSTQLVSLYQTNARAIKVQRQWAFNLLDANAAAIIEGTTA